MLTILGGASGFVGGAVFSIALGTVHRRHQLSELKTAKMALWGTLAGLLVPLGVVGVGIGTGTFPLSAEVFGTVLLFFGGAGAATSVGTVRIAQAAERQLSGPEMKDALPAGE